MIRLETYKMLSKKITLSARKINNLVCVSYDDFEYANFLYDNLIDLINKNYQLCKISYEACKYFNKRAWILAGEKLHDEIIKFNDSKRFK